MENRYKPIVLCVIDGFGLSSSWRGNAIFSANPKNFYDIWSSYPHHLLQYPGQSPTYSIYDNPEKYLSSILEGKEVLSQREYINDRIKDDSLFDSKTMENAYKQPIEKNSALHFIGNLSSSSGKYSDINHLFALLQKAKESNIFRIYIHLILDDTSGDYEQVLENLHLLETKLADLGVGEIASICGQNFLNETDRRSFLNFSKAYNAIAKGRGNFYLSAEQAINKNKKSDFVSNISPSVISSGGRPIGVISDFDSVFFFNHNNSELINLLFALSPNNEKNSKLSPAKFLLITTFFNCILPANDQVGTVFEQEAAYLPKAIFEAGLRQIYISDSSRILSMKSNSRNLVNGSDNLSEEFVPIMSANQYLDNPKIITEEIIRKTINGIKQKKYDFVLTDITCIDEAANKGTFNQTIKAVKIIDDLLPVLIQSVLDENGTVLLTSNYGNAEKMVHRSSYELLNSRTTNPVPLVLITNANYKKTANVSIASEIMCDMMMKKNYLTDITPTILELLNLPVPKELPGKSLVLTGSII